MDAARRLLPPDNWDYVTHMTGRSGRKRKAVPSNIAAMTGQQRLHAVLTEEQLRAFPPHGCNTPIVAFTETTQAGLEYLIDKDQFEPWGIVFHKDVIYHLGGGPVWYASNDQYELMRANELLRPWAVRTQCHGPRRSDWRHEREWRLIGDFPFSILDVHAVIAPQSEFASAHDVVDRALDDVTRIRKRRGITAPLTTPPVWLWDPRKSRLWEHQRFRQDRTLKTTS